MCVPLPTAAANGPRGLNFGITYISVSKSIPLAVTRPHGQLASGVLSNNENKNLPSLAHHTPHYPEKRRYHHRLHSDKYKKHYINYKNSALTHTLYKYAPSIPTAEISGPRYAIWEPMSGPSPVLFVWFLWACTEMGRSGLACTMSAWAQAYPPWGPYGICMGQPIWSPCGIWLGQPILNPYGAPTGFDWDWENGTRFTDAP